MADNEPASRADWSAARQRIAREGAGPIPKIYQLAGPHLSGHFSMVRADDQAALALAQNLADETGEPVIVAETSTGEIVIGHAAAQQEVADGLATRVRLVVEPGEGAADRPEWMLPGWRYHPALVSGKGSARQDRPAGH